MQDGDDRYIERSIVPTDQLVIVVSRIIRKYPILQTIIIGSGTGSRTLVRALKEALPGTTIHVVDEQGTSLLARERYLREHPPSGWKRLVPYTLLIPPEPYDDYAALLLAERYLTAQIEENHEVK